MTKYKGVRIVSVKVVKYEVRDPTGHTLHRASSSAAARSWVNGYLTASARALKQADVPAPPPAKAPRARRQKAVE